MGRLNGVNHIAICTRDIKTQIEFFTDVLGMELVALYWIHGVEGAWHGFLKLNDCSYVAFVQTPEVAKIERTLGVTHSGNAANPVAGGVMQHLALHVENEAELLAMRDRIRIDPEVVALAGISTEELDRYRNPASIDSQGDEVVAAQASETERPVAFL